MKRKHRGTRYFYIVTYFLMILATAIATVGFLRVYLRNDPRISHNETYDKYYVLITDDRESSFWQSVYLGACKYASAHNVYVENLGSELSRDYSKQELMKIAIASKVDGIIVNADDSKEMTALINQATAEGIPVVAANNDCMNSDRISYVGIGSYPLGKEYSKQIIEIANDVSYKDNSVVKVAVLVSSAPTSDQSIIYSGIQENLEINDENTAKVELSMVPVDDKNTFSVEESIRDIFIGEEFPDIIVCLNEIDTSCVYQAVIDYNKVGQVHILGYYDSKQVLEGIDRFIIDSTIKIDAEELGEDCVDALVSYGKSGYVNQYYTVDITLINDKNIKQYLKEAEDEET